MFLLHEVNTKKGSESLVKLGVEVEICQLFCGVSCLASGVAQLIRFVRCRFYVYILFVSDFFLYIIIKKKSQTTPFWENFNFTQAAELICGPT